jgi:type I restriction enzyme, S subunit
MPTTDAGPWMVTAKDVVDGVIDYTSARHTSRNAFETELTEKSRVRIGDVLLTKDGTLGRVAVVDRDDVCINQSVAVLRPNEQSNGVFLSRVLRAPQMQARLMKDSGGSAVKHLYITKVGETRFFLPSIEEQARISGILNGLEERLNASEKRLSELNGLKKSILEGEVHNAL